MPVAFRGLAAFLTGVMMFVLIMAESGFACAMPDMADMPAMGAPAAATHAGGAAGDMAGMSMPGVDAPAPDQPPDDSPCRFPWAPSGCRDMAPCAPATLAVAAWVPPVTGRVHDVQAPGPVTSPASVDTPPEPPPPRA